MNNNSGVGRPTDDADYELGLILVETDQERVVHDAKRVQEQGVVPDRNGELNLIAFLDAHRLSVER